MKIKMLKSVHTGTELLVAGTEQDIDANKAKEYVKLGYAKEVKEVKPQVAKKKRVTKEDKQNNK